MLGRSSARQRYPREERNDFGLTVTGGFFEHAAQLPADRAARDTAGGGDALHGFSSQRYCDRKQLKLTGILQMGTASSPTLPPFGLTGKAKPLLSYKTEVIVRMRGPPCAVRGAIRGKLAEFACQGAREVPTSGVNQAARLRGYASYFRRWTSTPFKLFTEKGLHQPECPDGWFWNMLSKTRIDHRGGALERCQDFLGPREKLRRHLAIRRRGILRHLFGMSCSNDGRGHLFAAQHPGKRELG
jgi:hypothetical protein